MFRPKIRINFSPDRNIPYLYARGSIQRRDEYILNNTKLHEAILENNHEKFKKLLEENESKNINEVSLMNTPLLLALKQGNIEISKCILMTSKNLKLKLNINHKDARGLTALDWACMLRNDDIIRMILSAPNFILSEESYAKILYKQSIDEKIFEQFLLQLAMNNAHIAENEGYPHLTIPFHEPYSDMIYFMKDICVNQGLIQEKDFPPVAGASHMWFYRCFKLGYQTFCRQRNQIPVDQEILTALSGHDSSEELKNAMNSCDENVTDRKFSK